MNGDTIYHLHFLSGGDFYFGSPAAIFDLFDRQTLKVSLARLYDFKITEGHPYTNKVCVIQKGVIRRKKGGRGQSKTV